MDAATEALRAFGGDMNRTAARALLSHWSRRSTLTPQEYANVLTRFPAAAKRRERECAG